MSRLPLLVAATLLFTANAAMAQLPAPGQRSETIIRSLHLAARNQLGLLEYCRAQGIIPEDVVAIQRRTVESLPAAPANALGEAEEAAGRSGNIVFLRPQATLAESAGAQGITVKAKCEHLALTVRGNTASR